MSISIYNRKDHGWRDAFNPLRGLSVPRLVALLEAGERGDYADIQWLYYYMERSDAVIYSVLQRRRAALLAVDWDIWLLDDGDPGLAREQAALLGEVYDRIDNFRDARVWLNLAKGEIRNRGESGVFGEPACHRRPYLRGV